MNGENWHPHNTLGPDEQAMWEEARAELEADLPPEGLMGGYSSDPYPGAPAEDLGAIENHNIGKTPLDDLRREIEGS